MRGHLSHLHQYVNVDGVIFMLCLFFALLLGLAGAYNNQGWWPIAVWIGLFVAIETGISIYHQHTRGYDPPEETP